MNLVTISLAKLSTSLFFRQKIKRSKKSYLGGFSFRNYTVFSNFDIKKYSTVFFVFSVYCAGNQTYLKSSSRRSKIDTKCLNI
jgi:hypothetical protein